MNASNPTTIDGKTYDRYALNLIISGTYDSEGQPEASVVCNLTPLRIEDGVVETAPTHSKSIRLGTLAVADAETLKTVGAIQAALQEFISAKGY
jgi:hypothetical protein